MANPTPSHDVVSGFRREDGQGSWRRVTHINASPDSAALIEADLRRRLQALLPDSGRIDIPCVNADEARLRRRIRASCRHRMRRINASPNSAALVDDGLLRRVRARLPDSGRIEIPCINADEARLRRRIRASCRRITRINTYRNSAAPGERDEAAALAGDTGVCAVCQDNYGENLKVRVLRCRHYFHADCIGKWLEIKNVCPLCNAVGWAA